MTDNGRRKQLSAAQRQERIDFATQEASIKAWLSDLSIQAGKLRAKDKEFFGTERELIHLQDKMIQDFEISKDIRHPRDVGTAREVLLKAFFIENRLLPRRYALSDTSVRVASTTGHLSNEIDILFYSREESFSLMQRQNIYEVLPIEYCYGAIQVKSKLTKKELKSAFDNIASVKKLKRLERGRNTFKLSTSVTQENCFGIIFAYDTELDWQDLAEEIKKNAETQKKTCLPNAIFVLTKGFFVIGDKEIASCYNSDIEKIKNITIHGFPDRKKDCLSNLYHTVFRLLKDTEVSEASPLDYFNLPITAGDFSYRYNMGPIAEIGNCKTHGKYAKTYPEEKIKQVIAWCLNGTPINSIRAMEIAYGQNEEKPEEFYSNSGDVIIYNPENLALSEILLIDNEVVFNGQVIAEKSIAFDSITSCGINMLIPYYYQITQSLVQLCPKCLKNSKRTTQKHE